VSGGLCCQLAFLCFLRLDLAHQAFAETGVARQAVVEARDLLAQVLALGLDQGLGVGLLLSGRETGEPLARGFYSAQARPSSGVRSAASIATPGRGCRGG
jgi:hypothetical protein